MGTIHQQNSVTGTQYHFPKLLTLISEKINRDNAELYYEHLLEIVDGAIKPHMAMRLLHEARAMGQKAELEGGFIR
jgi:hypothetical protein